MKRPSVSILAQFRLRSLSSVTYTMSLSTRLRRSKITATTEVPATLSTSYPGSVIHLGKTPGSPKRIWSVRKTQLRNTGRNTALIQHQYLDVMCRSVLQGHDIICTACRDTLIHYFAPFYHRSRTSRYSFYSSENQPSEPPRTRFGVQRRAGAPFPFSFLLLPSFFPFSSSLLQQYTAPCTDLRVQAHLHKPTCTRRHESSQRNVLVD
jgi:hypothetical protein